MNNLFELARLELKKKKVKFTALDVFDRAVAIRQRLDEQDDKQRAVRNKRYYLKKKSLRR